MKLDLVRTNSTNTDFVKLVEQLDAELAIIDGDDHAFYDQFNGIENLQYVVVGYFNNQPIACGAIKQYDNISVEVKRMYTLTRFRGKRIATQVLGELENWANELEFNAIILETGLKQKDAIALYEKNRYVVIPNYPPYENTKTSVCFKKLIK